ncbi:MAG: hypothetical protein ACRELV_14850, partial [Longimicrobiales bacterium]
GEDDVATLVRRLEAEHSTIVIALPELARVRTPGVFRPGAAAVLVVRAGSTLRTELQDALGALASVGVPLAAVVVQDARVNGAAAGAAKA